MVYLSRYPKLLQWNSRREEKFIEIGDIYISSSCSGNVSLIGEKLLFFKEHYESLVWVAFLILPESITESDKYLQAQTVPQNTGCYVATAVYGSYDCPQVWTLRRYRDYTLAQTWYGRAFIRTYYAISPTIVKWFGHTNWFRNMWKPRLDKMVKKLNCKGIKNTPYNDRKW